VHAKTKKADSFRKLGKIFYKFKHGSSKSLAFIFNMIEPIAQKMLCEVKACMHIIFMINNFLMLAIRQTVLIDTNYRFKR